MAELTYDKYQWALFENVIVDVLRKKTASTISKDAETNKFLTCTPTVPELLMALYEVFKPREVELAQALALIRQHRGQGASKTVKRIEDKEHNCAYPDDTSKIASFAHAHFQADHARLMSVELKLVNAANDRITMSEFELKAAEIDKVLIVHKADASKPTMTAALSGVQTPAMIGKAAVPKQASDGSHAGYE
jgi:hypothetical protein